MVVWLLLLVVHLPDEGKIAAERNAAPRGPLATSITSQDPRAELRQKLLEVVAARDEAGKGIFNEDVSSVVAPYFPPGESLKYTVATVQEMGLGDLEIFKGKTSPADGTLFVSRASLTDQVVTVVHVSFRLGADDRLVIDHTQAFLRAQGM